MQIQRFFAVLIVLSCLAGASTASAQTFSGDARTVGMGGVGDNPNIAFGMVTPTQPYTVIPIPLGLFQVFGNRKEFNPTDDKFDPVRAIEGASSPLHYTFGRSSSSTEDPQQRFVRDLVNGELNRDLSTYRGFALPDTIEAEGLASGGFGKTFKFAKKPNGAFQGIYIGAGPYLSFQTDATFDERLVDILSSDTAKYYPNAALQVGDGSAVQAAMSIIFGYRGRIALPGGSDESNDGVYVALNYRYLKGFKYIQPDMVVRFDTDAQGLVTINPATTPISIDNILASSGKGRAVDFGLEVVRNQWHAGFGANGISNQIDWTDLEVRRFTLNSLTQGGDFVEQTLPTSLTKVTVKLPVVTSGNFGFDAGGFAVETSAVHGFNGNSFHGGVERRLGVFAVRGGARFSRDKWDPTYGFGIGKKVALDVGFFSTHANLENERRTSMAVSIRINHDAK